MAVTELRADGSERVLDRRMRVAIVVSVLGYSLDLFDLLILLFVAPAVGALFFPSSIPTLSLAAVYASFAVTLLIRPVGAALFGNYADRSGRKHAMLVAIVGVGVATASFGLLPTFSQAGFVAPLLFLILRLVQGIFVGGTVASTHTIGTESVPPGWRGTMSGLISGGGGGVGALLASVVFLITSTVFPGDAFAVWGWRCMFFSGLLTSSLGLFIFWNLEELPLFREQRQMRAAAKVGEASPLRSLFAKDTRNVLLLNLMLTFGAGAGYYLTSGYLPTFLRVVNGVPDQTASLILMGASVMALVGSVMSGALSDVWGRRKTFLLAGAAMAVLAPLCYLRMSHENNIGWIAFYAFSLVFLGNAAIGPIMVFLNERFPTAIRATGTGLSWNIGFALGGLTPTFVSLASSGPKQIPMLLALFVAGTFVIYLAGALLIPETKGNFR